MSLAEQFGYETSDGCPSFLIPDAELLPITVEALVAKKTGSGLQGYFAAQDLHIVRMQAGIPGAEHDFDRRHPLQPHLF